ncbi:MAG: beta-ketoacyl-ACP synthase, partial [Hydrogenovibrio sp.]|uniref:beta-ketoacyl-ACP synthase n=1 Tax=Hydrogenovibrio sp. TaxID=2065821 RepID=UPI002870A70E
MNLFPHITASSLVTALGQGHAANLNALTHSQSGLRPGLTTLTPKLDATFGEIEAIADVVLPGALKDWHCRNHQLAWLALHTDDFAQSAQAAINRYGAHRIGVALGTSTSGILSTEQTLQKKAETGEFDPDYHYPQTHRMNALADFCAQVLGTQGPRVVISTACSSSAKVFATAQRWLAHDWVDAVVVGGVDTLCLTTLHGFNALDLISASPVKPLDANRDGINIGEAGGFMLLEKPDSGAASDVVLAGFGESSDAHHISAPHPEGQGAVLAMQAALTRARLETEDIDYINLHGTGTPSNDLTEAKALRHLFGPSLPAHSSTKGFTGHTLGAAGIVEAIFCQYALTEQTLWPNQNLDTLDPELDLAPVRTPTTHRVHHCMTNSFGFGGNNASLIFS